MATLMVLQLAEEWPSQAGKLVQKLALLLEKLKVESLDLEFHHQKSKLERRLALRWDMMMALLMD